MNDYVTIAQAASIENCSPRWIEKKVQQGKYKTSLFASPKNNGKKITKILKTSLSVHAQNKLIEKTAAPETPPTARPAPETQSQDLPTAPEAALAWYNNLPSDHKARIDDRLATLNAINESIEQDGAALKAICKEHDISQGTYYRWKSGYKKNNLAGLADNRFGQSRSKLNQAQRNYIVALIKQNPDRRTVRIFEYVQRKYPHNPVSGMTVSRFVDKWKASNHELFTFLKNPDKWKNDYQIAFGSQSNKAEHFLHYIELDSTPADVLCADGKRYNIIGGIDIFSRKPKCHVSPTSSGQGVAALLRAVILDWGVPENIVRDNGKDYTSNHIESVLNALEINAVTVAPFTPEGKPHIERFFRTLSGSLFEELHGYIGHNVAQRKAIESRRSFAKRFMNSEANPIQLNIYPDELQTIIDRWIETVYNHRVHKGINDTPEHKAAQSTNPIQQVDDERALDILLVPVGEATVQKKGIRYQNGIYQSPELSGWVRERVQVRRDMEDAGRLYMFDLDGQYVTTAWDPSIEGTPSIDYNAARKEQRRIVREKKAAIATLNENPMQDLIGEKTEQKTLVSLPRKRTAQTDALEEAGNAALQNAGVKPEKFKTVAEQMEESGWDIEETPGDDDPLDFLDNYEVVNS